MRKNWDKTKAVQQNLSDFGLAFNPNTCQKVNTTRSLLVQKAKEIREEAKVYDLKYFKSTVKFTCIF